MFSVWPFRQCSVCTEQKNEIVFRASHFPKHWIYHCVNVLPHSLFAPLNPTWHWTCIKEWRVARMIVWRGSVGKGARVPPTTTLGNLLWSIDSLPREAFFFFCTAHIHFSSSQLHQQLMIEVQFSLSLWLSVAWQCRYLAHVGRFCGCSASCKSTDTGILTPKQV